MKKYILGAALLLAVLVVPSAPAHAADYSPARVADIITSFLRGMGGVDENTISCVDAAIRGTTPPPYCSTSTTQKKTTQSVTASPAAPASDGTFDTWLAKTFPLQRRQPPSLIPDAPYDVAQFSDITIAANKDDSSKLMLYYGAMALPKVSGPEVIAMASASKSAPFSWNKSSANPVLAGTPGRWDANCIRSGTVLVHANKYYLYYSACGSGIGLATSDDGISFVKANAGEPILTADGDESGVYQPAVIEDSPGHWYMYYQANVVGSDFGGDYYRIATSADGITWTKTRINALQRGAAGTWDAGKMEAHQIMRRGNSYILTYEAGNTGFSKWAIGIAYSNDPLAAFTKYAGNPVVQASGITGSYDQYHVAGAAWFDVNGSDYFSYLGANTVDYAVADWAFYVAAPVSAPTPTPAPVPTSVPTCTLTASPSTIQAGGSSTLSWTTANATSITVTSGNNTVVPTTSAARGSQSVSPTNTVGYTGSVRGPGGSNTCGVLLTVTAAPAPTPPAPATLSVTINNPVNQTLTYPTTLFTSTYTITNGGASPSCQLLEAGGKFLATNPCSSGTIVWDTHAPSTGGTYPYYFRVTNGSQVVTTDLFTITVNPAPPSLTVTKDPRILHPGQNLTVYNNATNATSLSWSCKGNGNFSSTSGLQDGPRTVSWSDLSSAGWSGQYYCLWTAVGPGGTTTVEDDFYIDPPTTSLNSTGGNTNQTASVYNAFNSPMSGTSAPSAFSYSWNRSLQIGSQGVDVTALQTALAKEGVYQGDISGGFYNQTFTAVKAFQQKYGIEATGFVGPDTRAKLNALY